MTKYAQARCPGICVAIAQQLAWLARHPAPDIAPERRRLYRLLAEQRAEMAASADPRNPHHATPVAGAGTYLQ